MSVAQANQSIQLVNYTETFYEELSRFELPLEQREFTSLPMEKMNNPLVEDTACHIVILHEGQVVGYFTLEEGEKLKKYSQNSNAKLLTSFSINFPHQGKGYAKSALKQLANFVVTTYPYVDEIILGVNERNTAAATLYKKIGFVDKGEVFIGQKGPQHIMHLTIN